uniref:Uncharacterized protein n=1 Tax=Plectus sambesii TaxID=2011161 RepID=A0A914WGK0_9BILA
MKTNFTIILFADAQAERRTVGALQSSHSSIKQSPTNEKLQSPAGASSRLPTNGVDDFAPDVDGDRSFYEGAPPQRPNNLHWEQQQQQRQAKHESDEETNNMVATFQEDVASDDEYPSPVYAPANGHSPSPQKTIGSLPKNLPQDEDDYHPASPTPMAYEMPLPGSAEAAAKTPASETVEDAQMPDKLPSFSAQDLDSWFGAAETPVVKKPSSATVSAKAVTDEEDNDNPLVAPKPIDSDQSSDEEVASNTNVAIKSADTFDASPPKGVALFLVRDESPPKLTKSEKEKKPRKSGKDGEKSSSKKVKGEKEKKEKKTKKSSKEGRSTSGGRNVALEDFLGGPLDGGSSQPDDYDPL